METGISFNANTLFFASAVVLIFAEIGFGYLAKRIKTKKNKTGYLWPDTAGLVVAFVWLNSVLWFVEQIPFLEEAGSVAPFMVFGPFFACLYLERKVAKPIQNDSAENK